MGLFDVFSKGGKYFGKAIEPKCEYCEYGKRASDGNKVLCTKKGLVDASFHCPKFLYSPLKRIPVKQLERVGWLEGDYDEKDFAAIQKKKAEEAKNAKADEAKKASPSDKQAKPDAPAQSVPAAVKPAEPVQPAPAPAPVQPAAPVQNAVQSAPAAVKPAAPEQKTAQPVVNDLASLAAMAEAVGSYDPEPAPAEETPQNQDGMDALSSM